MEKQKLNIVTLIGTVVKMSEVSSVNHETIANDSTVVTLECLDGKVVDLWFNDSMIEEFGLAGILFEGNVVSVNAEERLAGITTYIDEDDNEQYHTVDQLASVNASHASAIAMYRGGAPEFIIKDVAELRKAHQAASVRTQKFYSAKNPTTDDVAGQIARLEKKLSLATGTVKDQIANRILELKATLPAKAKAEKV